MCSIIRGTSEAKPVKYIFIRGFSGSAVVGLIEHAGESLLLLIGGQCSKYDFHLIKNENWKSPLLALGMVEESLRSFSLCQLFAKHCFKALRPFTNRPANELDIKIQCFSLVQNSTEQRVLCG